MQAVLKRSSLAVIRWFDSWAGTSNDKSLSPTEALTAGVAKARTIDWGRVVPFVALHLSCLFVFVVGFSWAALITAVSLYVIRMFAITAGYHRYFSHRAYRTSRVGQFCLAVLGASAAQRGPLWWAAHHRHHHKHSDDPLDIHSPKQQGIFWSHIGWVLDRSNFRSQIELIKDFAKFPELRFLDRFDILVPVLLGVSVFLWGVFLEAFAPGLGTNGWQMLVWGFVVSTIALYHGTFTVNSLAHLVGKRRFETKDTSRNNWFIAIITLGEGWHNNHHHYQASARQGFYWWELDVSYYILKTLSVFGIVWDLRPVPKRALTLRRIDG
ncbi:Fatty acid desaturase [Planctomycetes bacterium Poly30]|uniref:Fatty acid desaturase n=1 Tax=Saltatorellus ferox TaxID=2528018 RepID=A0A518EVF2_9BACT|nr:Fatty acid desaturase [Planctomycetes bacterium Poly30]